MGSRFRNIRDRAVDLERATKSGTRVEFDGDPPFALFVLQHRGANRRSLYVAAQIYADARIDELEGVARYEALRELETELAATELVVGWDGLVDDQGDPVDCSPDNVRALLEEVPDALARILEAAQDETRFRLSAGTKSDP